MRWAEAGSLRREDLLRDPHSRGGGGPRAPGADRRRDRAAGARHHHRKVEALTAKVAELEPAAKSWNHLADAEGNFAVADAAKILSQDPAISIGRDRLFAFMESIGWVYRQAGKRGGWRAYQSQVDIGRLYERPARPFLNTRTGDMELPAPTVRVAAKGLAKLRELLVARAAA
ncbi:hypothetical protein GS461_13645 [Rhodococcus hoagii]|nr:hypothetical protein [Prescottella equi]